MSTRVGTAASRSRTPRHKCADLKKPTTTHRSARNLNGFRIPLLISLAATETPIRIDLRMTIDD